MASHVSFMLDNMIMAVEAGFSYDGIVSIPETGLEDVREHRSGLAGSLCDSAVSPLSNLLAAGSRGLRSRIGSQPFHEEQPGE